MMKAKIRFFLGCAVTPSLFVTLVSGIAFAGSTWTGGGISTNWSDDDNWDGSAPGYGTLTFTTGGTQGTGSINDDITAQNQLQWSGSESWILDSDDTVLALFDNSGIQAKIENKSSGLVTINAHITFAATSGQPYGEINAINGNITFGDGTLTVNGSAVGGIKLFGAGNTTTFNNPVSASGKWFGLTAENTTMAVGGGFTSGDIYVMNGGALQLNSGGSITSSAIRLGGDFGNTSNQNQALGGTLQFTSSTGEQSFASVINTVGGNTSEALLLDSLNTSNTNTISGNIFLDSALRMNQVAGGSLSITNATLDLKAQTLTLTGGGQIGITGIIGNSIGSGSVVIGADGVAGGPTVIYSSANTYSGDTYVRAGSLAFNSGASAGSSVIRLGSTSGDFVDASIILNTPGGGTTLSTTINPVGTSGSGDLAINSKNTSGINTLSGHIGFDRNLAVTQAAGGTLNLTQVKGVDNTTGTDIKGHTLTLAAASTGTINHSGTIYNSTGTGNLIANGNGTVIFSGTNSYSGATAVTAGKLLVNGDQSAAGGAVTVSSGAKLGGSGTIGGATTIESGGIHSAGDVVTATNPSGAGTIDKGTFSNGLTYEENSIFEWNLTADSTTSTGTRGNDYDAVNASSLATDGAGAIFRVVLNSGQNFSESFWDSDRTWSNIFTNVAGDENLSIASIFGGGFEYRNANGAVAGVETSQGYFSFGGTGETHTLNWTAVPEPTSALAGLLLGAGLLRRRRAAILKAPGSGSDTTRSTKC